VTSALEWRRRQLLKLIASWPVAVKRESQLLPAVKWRNWSHLLLFERFGNAPPSGRTIEFLDGSHAVAVVFICTCLFVFENDWRFVTVRSHLAKYSSSKPHVAFLCYAITVKSFAKRFLPRDAMHKRGLCRHAVSVCPSACLSRSWVASKRIKISSKLFHHRVAKPF